MRERNLIAGMGLGAAIAHVIAASASVAPMLYEHMPLASRDTSTKPSNRKKYPRARKRDWKFEARVAATNSITHPRHLHPRHKRPAVTVAAVKEWEARVASAAATYKGGKL